MSYYDYYRYYPVTKPIKTDEGIKARSKRGDFVKNWWATRWINALERLVDRNRLQRGRRYARAGQVIALDEEEGEIQAQVQGSSPRPYDVTISLDPLTDKQWDKVVEILAEQALFTAQLLAGEMPPEIENAFQQAGVSLLPDSRRALHTDCSCPDSANPCKHIAAVHYILGEQFDEDPFLIFRLRGRDQETLMAALRAKRASEAGSDWEEGPEEAPEETVEPLSDTIAAFWGDQTQIRDIQIPIRKPSIDYPLLKRLGQPSFLAESATALLGPVYRNISKTALNTVYQDPKSSEDE